MKLLLPLALIFSISSFASTTQTMSDEVSDDMLVNIANKIINNSVEEVSERDLRKEIIAHPKRLLPRIKMARLLITKDKFYQATAFLRRGVYYNQEDWRGWYWLGTSYLVSDDLKHANKSMDVAIKISKDNIYPIMQKALILQESKKWAESLTFLKHALRKYPNNPIILLNIGYSAEMNSNVELMAQAYERFLQATEGNLKYSETRAIVLEVIGGRSDRQ